RGGDREADPSRNGRSLRTPPIPAGRTATPGRGTAPSNRARVPGSRTLRARPSGTEARTRLPGGVTRAPRRACNTTRTAARSPRRRGTDPTTGGRMRHTRETTRCPTRSRNDLEAGYIEPDRRTHPSEAPPPTKRTHRPLHRTASHTP